MAKSQFPVLGPNAAPQNSGQLNSWKEIAAYFNRDVRTVRRWESELGLPVHRRQHLRRGIVYAYQSELDAWWRDGSKTLHNLQTQSGPSRLFRTVTVTVLVIAAGSYSIWMYFHTRTQPHSFEVTRTTRLTSAGRAVKAAISPDGRYVAYTQITSGRQSLFVRRRGTVQDNQIVPPASPYFLGITFSPDSETVYYATRTPGVAPARLYRIPVIGGVAQELKEGIDSPVTFSPDGKKIAFIRETEGTSTLVAADLNSGVERPLVSRKLPLFMDYPAWSPDGQIIACTVADAWTASLKGSNARILGVRVEDQSETPVSTLSWPFIRQLAWLSRGHGLVMSARDQETGLYHIWHVPYPDGSPRKITDGLNSQDGVSLSTDSSRLVTVEERTVSYWISLRSHCLMTSSPSPTFSVAMVCAPDRAEYGGTGHLHPCRTRARTVRERIDRTDANATDLQSSGK